MQGIYTFVSENPHIITWAFAVVNALWLLFVYFNKKSHEKDMINLQHSLNIDLERRKKVFELKAVQYENYVARIDEFGKRYKVEIPQKIQPIFNKYSQDYLSASLHGNKEKEKDAIIWFSNQVSEIFYQGSEDFRKLEAESSKLKLTCSDQMLILFEELEILAESSMQITNQLMENFVTIIITNNQEAIKDYYSKAEDLGNKIKYKSKELLNQMRLELSQI